MIGHANFNLRAGDTFQLLFEFCNDAAETIPTVMDGKVLVVTLKRHRSDGEVVATQRQAVATQNTLSVAFVPATTIGFSGAFLYDAVVLEADGSEHTRLEGVVVFEKRIKQGVG